MRTPFAVKTKTSHTGPRGTRVNASCFTSKQRVNLGYDPAQTSSANHVNAARLLASKRGAGDRLIISAEGPSNTQIHMITTAIDPAHQYTIEVVTYYPKNYASQFKARAMRGDHEVLIIEGGGTGDYGAHAICKRLSDAGLIPKYEGYYNSLVIRETVEAKCIIREVEKKRDFQF